MNVRKVRTWALRQRQDVGGETMTDVAAITEDPDSDVPVSSQVLAWDAYTC